MRVYDPRLGKFLSMDMLYKKYPELTPYQFASNTPIRAVDLDGAEMKDVNEAGWGLPGRERSEDIRRRLAKKDGHEWILIPPAIVIGGSLASVSLPPAANWGTRVFWKYAFWVSQPQSQLMLSTSAGFVFNMLSPDPGTHVEFPGYGDEIAQSINWALKNKAGKTVHFLAQEGAVFSNKSESYWAQKLLDEGNNVMLWKDIQQKGVRNGDLWVNGLRTELKEISNMTQGSNMIRNLVNKFRDAADQATSVIIDGTKQAGFTVEVAREALRDVGRKGVKSTTQYRILGKGFDIRETIKAK